jgi:hypothetical protein
VSFERATVPLLSAARGVADKDSAIAEATNREISRIKPQEAYGMDRRYCWAVFVAALLATLVISGCGGGSSTSTGPLTTNITGLANGTVGVPYFVIFTESGGTAPYTWSQVSGGDMPGGLTFSSAGILTGTPTAAGSFGPYVFKVTDTNSATASTGSLSLTISATTLTVTTSSLPSGTIGTPYSVTLAASGGTAPYTWAETSGGALPGGLSLSGAVLSGTPTTAGTYGPYVFTATDSANKTAASGNLSITIAATSATGCTPGGAESQLTSPYAFLVKGSDGNGNPLYIAGSFTPNGQGGITNAAVDYNGLSNGHEQLQVNLANSSYSFSNAGSTNGQGCLSLSFTGLVLTGQADRSSGSTNMQVPANRGRLKTARPEVSSSIVSGVQFSFVLSGTQNGSIIESDFAISGTYASGFLHLQDPTAFQLSSLATNFAFGADGWTATTNPGLERTAIAGTFVNTSGTISAGYADLNVGGTASGEQTGGQGNINSTIDATTGRGTGSYFLALPHGQQLTMDFAFYILNGSDIILLSTDAAANDVSSPLLAGRALVGTSSYTAGPLNGYYLLASQGLEVNGTTAGNLAEIGILNATNGATIPTANFYSNDAGTYTPSSYSGGSYVVEQPASGVPFSGRVSFAGLNATPPVLYLTSGNNSDGGIVGFLVGTDPEASSGILVFQPTGPYSDASVTGHYSASTAEDVDGLNGAYLGLFDFPVLSPGTYSVVSQVTGSVPNTPNLGTISFNADGSGAGNLDGGNFLFVTNGQILFGIPDTGDPLLFILTNGVNP